MLYLFRPTLDRVGKSEKPTLTVDDQLVGAVSHSTYTFVSLKPGRHRLKLIPGPGESSGWNTEVGFEVTSGETYFVAIWNQDQRDTRRAILPIPVPGSLYFVSIGGPFGPEPRVRFEPVDRDVGVTALVGLRFFEAQASHLTAQP